MWLGRWYHEVGNDLHKAKGCYEEALVMNPKNKEVALALREINQDLGMKEQADELAHLTDSKTPTRLSIDGANPSAFAAASSEAFDNHSKQGKNVNLALYMLLVFHQRSCFWQLEARNTNCLQGSRQNLNTWCFNQRLQQTHAICCALARAKVPEQQDYANCYSFLCNAINSHGSRMYTTNLDHTFPYIALMRLRIIMCR